MAVIKTNGEGRVVRCMHSLRLEGKRVGAYGGKCRNGAGAGKDSGSGGESTGAEKGGSDCDRGTARVVV